MDENEALNDKGREVLFPFLITQCICVAVIIITLFATKLFFKGTYEKARLWYKENMCTDTDVNEVLSDNIKNTDLEENSQDEV